MSLETLFQAARQAQARAYAPYSGFRVGAAVRGEGGAIFAGCNVENAAYPVGLCAEASAIAAMIAGGERRLAELVVLGDGDTLVTPCGACRQRIGELAAPGARIHAAGPHGVRRTFSLEELLPFAFGLGHVAGQGSRSEDQDVGPPEPAEGQDSSS
jgi:cytidine deaminase